AVAGQSVTGTSDDAGNVAAPVTLAAQPGVYGLILDSDATDAVPAGHAGDIVRLFVDQPPHAVVDAPRVLALGDDLELDASLSRDPDEPVPPQLSFAWDLN